MRRLGRLEIDLVDCGRSGIGYCYAADDAQ